MKTTHRLAAAGFALAALAACQPLTTELDPLRVTTTAYCSQADGVEVQVTNIGDARVPVTVSLGGAVYDARDYATPTRMVDPGDDTVYSFPGSRPEALTVSIGGGSGVGWISHDLGYGPGECVR